MTRAPCSRKTKTGTEHAPTCVRSTCVNTYSDRRLLELLLFEWVIGLCYTVLCCAVLCYAVPCCAMMCRGMLCCAVLCCAVLCCAVLRCALLCSRSLYSTKTCSFVLRWYCFCCIRVQHKKRQVKKWEMKAQHCCKKSLSTCWLSPILYA